MPILPFSRHRLVYDGYVSLWVELFFEGVHIQAYHWTNAEPTKRSILYEFWIGTSFPTSLSESVEILQALRKVRNGSDCEVFETNTVGPVPRTTSIVRLKGYIDHRPFGLDFGDGYVVNLSHEELETLIEILASVTRLGTIKPKPEDD